MHTNCALVDVQDAAIEVGVMKGYDVDKHQELERLHSGTHVFRRRDDALEVVRLDSGACRIGEEFYERSARAAGRLLPALIEEGIRRFLCDSGSRLEFRRRRPLEVVSLEPKNDLARQLFSRQATKPLPLRVRRGHRIEARGLFINDRRRVVVVLDAEAYCTIDCTIADLLVDGFDPAGLYAQIASGSSETLFRERRLTIGVIDSAANGRVSLGSDRKDDEVEFAASELYLDPSPAAVARVLSHYIGPEAYERLWGERGELSSGTRRLERIDGLRRRLAREDIVIAPGVTCRIGEWISAEELGAWSISKPQFVVGSGGGKDASATTGVFREGPRQAPRRLSGSRVRACVICEAAHRLEVDAFLGALVGGLGAHRGLVATWRLPEVAWQFFPVPSASATAYEDACRSALDSDPAFDLAFVQTPDGSKELRGGDNPYLVTKAKFLARNIPVQEFRLDTMRKPESVRQWALGGIALQVFAKLGGLPWLLKSPSPPPWEVVVGLGSAQLGTGRFGRRERIVGLATAFSGDGTYWLTEASRVASFADHEAVLGESAVAALRRARTEMGWRPGDPVHVVIHSFKDFRGAHIDSILSAFAELELQGHPVKAGFVHVAETHPFLLFDAEHRSRVPPRGIAVPLSDHEALISMLGPDEMRSEKLGFPRPLLLKVHRASTLTDLNHLAIQVLAFAAHSWRNFSPTSVPVTIQYANLIADLLGRLGDLPKWDPDVLRGPVGTSRWFL